jgi:hypothetical protein
VGQYFSAYTIRSMISDAQKRVDGLVEGFMVRSGSRNRIFSDSSVFIAGDCSEHKIRCPAHSRRLYERARVDPAVFKRGC